MVIKKKEQTFNRKQRYINRSGKRIGQGVWYDENGHMIKPGEAVYDKDTHLVTQCNMDGTKTVYTREQWHKKKTKDHETRVLQNDRKWSIPYLPEKEMTLTIDTDSPTRRNDGITFSENVLDSIAINAQRAGIPFSTGLALASTESTIGNAKGRGVGTTVLPWMRVLNQSKDSYKQGAKKISYDGVYSPTALISNWKQRAENPYYDYEYTDKGQLRTTYQPESFYKKDFRPSVNKDTDYVFDNKSPLQHGFEKYREDPHKYNYGDPHYPDKVEANRQELIHYSPEIKAYMQKNNLKADGGFLDNTWNSLSLKDKAEMIKVAVRNGITTLPEVKKAYNKFAEGGPKETWTMQDEADKAYGGNLFKDGGKKTSTTDNSQRAMNYLKSKGMNHIAASAIIGTLQAESGMNPAIHAQMKGDTGEGLAQWTGSRKNKFWSTLEKIEPGARKRYGSIVNVPLERQLDVVMSERPDIIFAINNANDIHTATDLMLRGYENGGGNIDSLASKSQMNSIYGKWNNGYDRQFNTRLNYAKNLLGADPSQYTLSQNALDAVNTEINDIDLSKLSTSELPLFGVPGMDNNPANSYKAPVIIQEEEPKAASIAEFKYDPQEERLDNMRTMSNAFSMMGIENPFMDTFRQVDSYSNNPLMAIANISAYGGNLYANGGEKASITAKPSRRYSLKNNILGQQTVYKDGDEYYVLDKNSHRIPLTRDGEWGNSGDPSTWQFKDANGKTYSPQGTHYGESIIQQEKGLADAPMTLKTINGLLNLPFEGLSYVATGDGLQHNLPEEGDALLETTLLTAPIKELGPIGKKIKGKLNIEPKYETIIKEEPNTFKSSLDWSPESWFGTRTGNIGYNLEDVEALKSHIPEYLQIEQQAKANGTWLKMPDGSIWEGDPRSWVQMMSKAYDKYTGNSPFKYDAFSHGSDASFDTFDLKYFGKTDEGFYGKGFYTHPAENINSVLRGRNGYGDKTYLLTTNVERPLDLNNPDFKYAGLFNRENTNAPKGIFDNYDSVYYGVPGYKTVGASPSELVVPEPTNYKSLLGNNGNFNPLNPNMYKALLPLGIPTISLNYLQSE